MTEKISKTATLYIEDLINDLRWCDIDPPEFIYEIDIGGSSLTLNKEQACKVVDQYDTAKSVINIPFVAAQTASLNLTIDQLGGIGGLKKLEIDDFLPADPKVVDKRTAINNLSRQGITAKHLFRLFSIREFMISNKLDYKEAVPYLAEGIKYDLLDDMFAYMQNNYGERLELFDANRHQKIIRTTTFEDIKSGLLALVSLGEFRHLLENRYDRSIEEIRSVVPEAGVVEMMPHIVEGHVKIGVEPQALMVMALGNYSRVTNSLAIRETKLDDWTGYKIQNVVMNGNLYSAAAFLSAARVVALHELTHAWQDKMKIIRAPEDIEGAAWRIQEWYDLLTVGREHFDVQSKVFEANLIIHKNIQKSVLYELLPEKLADIIYTRFVKNQRYLFGRLWAPAVDAYFQGRGDLGEMYKLEREASQMYVNFLVYGKIHELLSDNAANFMRLGIPSDAVEKLNMTYDSYKKYYFDMADQFMSITVDELKKQKAMKMLEELQMFIIGAIFHTSGIARSGKGVERLEEMVDDISKIAYAVTYSIRDMVTHSGL